MKPIQPPADFFWDSYGAYSAFDSFLQSFVIERKSFITKHTQTINALDALSEINSLFVDGFDEGKTTFDEKATRQFINASENAKIFFANAEYLWAMPSSSMKPTTKREYASRWFDDDQIKDDSSIYFTKRDGIASPGQYYQTNKYHELLAIFRILSHLVSDEKSSTVESIKSKIEALSYEGLYGKPAPHGGFNVRNYCGVHAALLHLSAPDKYESIISKGNKEQIIKVFKHIIADRSDLTCKEKKINLIRDRIYDEYGETDSHFKFRWFFYCDEVKRRWISKTKARHQNDASIDDEIHREEYAPDIEDDEGKLIQTDGYRVYRYSKLVEERKVLDGHTCKACDFHFKNKIVHVHHIDPLSERKTPRKTTLDDLITLCPNCHYLAHYLLRLRKGDDYKDREVLLTKLREIT